MTANLLVVDYDYFFPNPMESTKVAKEIDPALRGMFDWGHSESIFFLSHALWSIRAATFLAYGHDLPQVVPPEDGWGSFWDRFTFADGATMTYADSNLHAGKIEADGPHRAFDSIHLFDAHHDSGYHANSFAKFLDTQTYSCEDWMLYQQAKGCFDLTVHYPRWKPNGLKEKVAKGSITKQVIDDLKPLDTVFTDVFVCRSGAWVPPWCDRDFLDLIDASPLHSEQIDEEDMDREFTTDEAEAIASTIRHSADANAAARAAHN